MIQRLLLWRYGLDMSVGQLAALTRGVAERGQEEYAQLREEGRNGYLWSFSAPNTRYFLHRASWGREVIEKVLGEEFDGVLVSDFYGSYNVYQGLHQRCWTHLLRDIHQLKERFPQHHAQAYSGPDPGLLEAVRQPQRVKQQQRFQAQLWSICKPYLGRIRP